MKPNPTKTEIVETSINGNDGYSFAVYFNSKGASIIGACYRTKKRAKTMLFKYLATGSLETYGDFE